MSKQPEKSRQTVRSFNYSASVAGPSGVTAAVSPGGRIEVRREGAVVGSAERAEILRDNPHLKRHLDN